MTSYRDSRAFGIDDICRLLQVVDGHLTDPAAVVIIGGAAAAFHRADSTTNDVDTNDALNDALQDAIQRARAETGLEIPINHSAVADVPWHFEDRLERQLPELRNLQVWVLEKHDLVLSKSVRCDEHDLEQLEELHAKNPLDFDVLVTRFRTEMTHAIGEPAKIRERFLEMIERLSGELKRVEADRATR